MKTKFLFLIMIIVTITIKFSFAQKWEKDQPNKLFAVDKQGNFNNIRVGIGTNNPQYPLEVIGIAKADSLVINNGAHIFGTLHIGTNSLILGQFTSNGANEIYSTTGDLYIQSDVPYNTIFGSSTYPNSVGINNNGPFSFDPSLYGLDVKGDINITDANYWLSPSDNYKGHGYRIKGITVLQTQRDNNSGVSLRNIFVGEDAGFTWESSNVAHSVDNTYVGFEAGYNTQQSDKNTFIGSQAGHNSNSAMSIFVGERCGLKISGENNLLFGNQIGSVFNNTSSTQNVIIGNEAGFQLEGSENNNTIVGYMACAYIKNANNNTFIGNSAGTETIGLNYKCLTGSYNTSVGNESGIKLTSGQYNTFLGNKSGLDLTIGVRNICVGNIAGLGLTTGKSNVFLGSYSVSNLGSDTNSVVIGAYTKLRASNKIILGNNNQNVGIGLSDDTYANGPQAKLEIDAGLNGVNPESTSNVGASGLRFRDLRHGNLINPGPYSDCKSSA